MATAQPSPTAQLSAPQPPEGKGTARGGAPAPQPPATLRDLAQSVRERVRLEGQAQRARERLKVLSREADDIALQQRTVLGQLRRLEIDRERYTTEEQGARAAGALAQSALAETERRVGALEAAIAAKAPAVRARVVRLYQVGPLDGPRHWARADTLVRTARAWRLLAAVAVRDRDVLTAAARDRAALEALRQEQRAQVAETETQTARAAEANAAARRAVAGRQALLSRLDQERDLAARLVGELQEADDRLRTLLSGPPGPDRAQAQEQAAGLPIGPFKGDLDWPADGILRERFGQARQSRFGTVLPRNGVEIGAPESAPVTTPHEGRVVFSNDFAGLGRLVIVEHGPNAFTLYGHLGSLAVERGEVVSKGSRLGTVGRTPAGDEALYFELRVDGQPVDPLEWMKPAPLRRAARP